MNFVLPTAQAAHRTGMARRTSIGLLATLGLVASSATSAHAQVCKQVVTTSMLQAFESYGNPKATGEAQSSGSAWTYRRETHTGPLLTGGFMASSFGTWLSAGKPFSIPAVGPIASPTPAKNQNVYHDRPASFDGLFFHPGNIDIEDVVAVFAPQRSVSISSVQLQAEIIGDASNGIVFTVAMVKGAVTQSLILPTVVNYTASGSTTLNATIPTPIDMNPGDVIYIVGDRNGVPTEDWGNVDLRVGFSGGPVVVAPPRNTSVCAGATAELKALGVGSGTISYKWRRNNVDLVDGPTGTGSIISGSSTAKLQIQGVSNADIADYDCRLTSECNNLITSTASIILCYADCDCDGNTTIDDFICFQTLFALGDPTADCDGDTILSIDDFICFQTVFAIGC